MGLETLFTAVAVALCAAPGHPIVAEVYYDAPGDDTGHEFVEFFNPTARALPLVGARIEAGDGAGAGRWTLRWTGTARDSVAPGGRFVVGGAAVVPAADAVVTLDLQNGPDGVRVRWPGGATETVGWGALALAEYSCGEPAPDAPAGQSLARLPDDADRGSNALDFRTAEPSPGRANQPARDLALLAGSLRLAPEQPAPGAAVGVSLALFNRGREDWPPAASVVRFAGDALADTLVFTCPVVAAGETLRVAQAGHAGLAGRRTVRARALLVGDADSANDQDSLAVRVGEGPLELTEIQFHPAAGEGEWVEVRNRSGAFLALAAFTLSDRSGTRARLLASAELAPDSLAVLAQDRTALLASRPGLDTARVVSGQPWPSLNNTYGDSGTADDVVVRDESGLPCDRYAYSAAGVAAGATLEKTALGWQRSSEPAGTPLRFPGVDGAGTPAFTLAPRRVAAGVREVALAWQLPWARADVTVELYDMEGHRAAVLLAGVTSGPHGEARVRVDGAGPGLFAAVLRAHGATGTLTRTALVRIAAARP